MGTEHEINSRLSYKILQSLEIIPFCFVRNHSRRQSKCRLRRPRILTAVPTTKRNPTYQDVRNQKVRLVRPIQPILINDLVSPVHQMWVWLSLSHSPILSVGLLIHVRAPRDPTLVRNIRVHLHVCRAMWRMNLNRQFRILLLSIRLPAFPLIFFVGKYHHPFK